LRGWKATGSAFECQPTLGDNPTARGLSQPANQQGRFWIGTFECYQGPGREPGATQGDRPTGTLTSGAFEIPAGWLSFRIGGGSSRQTRVELLIHDQIEQRTDTALSASGRNSETMSTVKWDLNPFAGRTGLIRIVDEATGGWGHVNVDDFRFGTGRAPRAPDEGDREVIEPGRPQAPAETTVLVPPVVGFDVEVARGRLTAERLILGEVEERPSDAPPGEVIDQTPEAGTRVEPGTAVNVVVALGVEVPPLIGLDVREAEARLRGRPLRLGRVREERSAQPVGSIVDQNPKPGSQVPARTRVDITVAQGVAIPDLSTTERSSIDSVLRRAGLAVGDVRETRSAAAVGSILSQEPRAGAVVPLETPVDVEVAQGVAVPDLSTAEWSSIESVLRRAGLAVGDVRETRSAADVGSILSQEPQGGAIVPLETPVDVEVAQGVTVPDLSTAERASVESVLRNAGLVVGDVRETRSAADVGSVLSQEPQAGRVVPLETPVDVEVAQGVTVPDLSMTERAGVESVLRNAGLAVGDVRETRSAAAVGSILSQEPQAGTIVPLETPVDVEVARGTLVPDLSGAVSTEADSRLAPDLRLGRVETEVSEQPVGSVLSQSPAAGEEVPLETRVDLLIAEGLQVPNLVGRLRAEAETVIADSRLALGSIEERASERPLGSVLAQDPPADAVVPLGASVNIFVARGSEVPAIVGLSQEEAIRRVTEEQLAPGEVTLESSREMPGTVLSATPGPGTTVPLATRIDLVVALGISVPDVIGQNREEAERHLAAVELRVGPVDMVAAYRWPGTVVEQRPTANTQVGTGSEVALTLANPPMGAIGGGLAGLLALVGGGFALLRRFTGRGDRNGEPHVRGDLEFEASTDPGSQELEIGTDGLVGAELSIRAVAGSFDSTVQDRPIVSD